MQTETYFKWRLVTRVLGLGLVGIADGDTLTLLVPDGASYRQVKVRLSEIDPPESLKVMGEYG